MSKKHISALIIIFVGLVSFFLILNSNKKEGGDRDLITNLESIKNNPYLNFEARPRSTFFPSLAQISNNELTQETDNLTEILAQLYSQKIIQKNLNSNDSQKGIEVIPVEILTDQIIQEGLEFSLEFLQFETKDIKITYDNSTEKKFTYLQSLSVTAQKNFGGFNKSLIEILDEVIINQNFWPLQQYTKVIPTQINDLLKMEVPSVWKIFHLQNLNLWQKSFIVFTAIYGINEDPVKTSLAFQQIPDILEESLDLQSVLIQQIEEL